MNNVCSFCTKNDKLTIVVCDRCDEFAWGCESCFNYTKSPCRECRQVLRDIKINNIIEHK